MSDMDAETSYWRHKIRIAYAKKEGRIKPQQVISDKTGRNEPCPCGSGRKYKKCCGGF